MVKISIRHAAKMYLRKAKASCAGMAVAEKILY
jgi:hypothetical protein